jgi:LacI family transcriptional regulator
MATIGMKELARELKLSTATVSKALRDSYDISEETKQRVLKLAREWNYIPNAHASSLRGKKSKTIAVVIPEVADSYFAQAINGVETVAQKEGFHVLVYLTHEQVEKENLILKELLNGRVDGILISVTSQSQDVTAVNKLKQAGIPVVFFDRVLEGVGDGQIITNDFEASYKLTAHLIEQDCKNIAFLLFSESLNISTQRMNGYKSAIHQYALSLQDKNLLICTNQDEENRKAIHQLLQAESRPDAIIASVEKLILPTYLACAERNLVIPNDIKVAAFSNLMHASILNPAITTITQPAFEMGKVAAELLLKALKGKPIDQDESKIVLPSILEIRTSSKLFL